MLSSSQSEQLQIPGYEQSTEKHKSQTFPDATHRRKRWWRWVHTQTDLISCLPPWISSNGAFNYYLAAITRWELNSPGYHSKSNLKMQVADCPMKGQDIQMWITRNISSLKLLLHYFDVVQRDKLSVHDGKFMHWCSMALNFSSSICRSLETSGKLLSPASSTCSWNYFW